MSDINETAAKIFNDILYKTPELRSLFSGNQARYHYYTDGYTRNMYFYTVAKIPHKGKKKYVAGIYRYYKTKKSWRPTSMVGFARKRKSMEWAQKMADKMKEYYGKLKEGRQCQAKNESPMSNQSCPSAPGVENMGDEDMLMI